MIKDKRDKLEDLFIKDSGQFAFVDPSKLNPKYIEWLEDKALENIELREACQKVVDGYEGDGFENMGVRDDIFYKYCNKALKKK